MNIPDLAKISDANARELKLRMDRMLPGEKLTFSNFGPLVQCRPEYADLSFFKENNRYCMTLDRNVRYSGSHPPMMHLVFNDPVFFREFHMMLDYLRELPCDDPPPEHHSGTSPASRAPLQEDYDLGRVADMKSVTVPKHTALATPDFATIRNRMRKSIIGQDEAVDKICYQTALYLQKKNPKRPDSHVLFGPTGSGKTEAAKVLAKILEPLGYSMVFTELNTFTESHSVYRLLGAPPGYVGYEDTPVFEAVRRNEKIVFIFDELEKAHPEVIKTFMSVLDSGQISSRKELADGSREYDFKQCTFIFTSNLDLGSAPKKRIGFSASENVENIQKTEDTVEVTYKNDASTNEQLELTRRIYRDTEKARKAFVKSGVLKEIASRFNSFVEFKALSDEAKVSILIKMVLETSTEYGIRIVRISTPILQGLIDAVMCEDALVRSFRAVIIGYLAATFAEASEKYGTQAVKLEGTVNSPVITPVK